MSGEKDAHRENDAVKENGISRENDDTDVSKSGLIFLGPADGLKRASWVANFWENDSLEETVPSNKGQKPRIFTSKARVHHSLSNFRFCQLLPVLEKT